jgi:hypothetical protein
MARLGMDIAGSHGNRMDATFVAGTGSVDGILGKNHRIVVGKCNTCTVRRLCSQCDGLRAGLIHQAIHILRLADIPVLAEFTGQVAPRRTKGKHRGTWIIMIERFLLDRIDTETGRTPVGGKDHAFAFPHTHETRTALTITQLAVTRTQVTLNAPVR